MKKIFSFVILLSIGITQIYAQACLECATTTASGNKATSIGYSTTASGLASFAGGNSSEASGHYSFAFGNYAKALNLNGIALGNYAVANFDDGIAIGSNLTSNAANSYVFGKYLTGGGSNSLTFGIGASSTFPLVNNISNSIMFGVNNSPSLTIVKPKNGTIGYIGIGTDDPREMAHVVGKLLIERTGETESSLQFKYSNTRGLPPSNHGSCYWDIYPDTAGLKFNTIVNKGAYSSSSQSMIISSNGSVGIGIGMSITAPKAKLHVGSNILANGNITTLKKFVLSPAYDSESDYWEISRTSTGLYYGYMDQRMRNILFLGNDGSIGVGTPEPNATLEVNGSLSAQSAKIRGLICAEEIRVQLKGAECWPDFVFGKNYKLLPLVEVEQFITENQHLPNVPSSAEVEANGVELGVMNALLLQKVEELTLYIIQMEKRLAELEHKKGGE